MQTSYKIQTRVRFKIKHINIAKFDDVLLLLLRLLLPRKFYMWRWSLATVAKGGHLTITIVANIVMWFLLCGWHRYVVPAVWLA